MGNESNVKTIRKQLRNVVQEQLPMVVTSELANDIYLRLQKEVRSQLMTIEANITATLAQMNERSKDVQSFIMNQVQTELAAKHRITAPSIDSETTVLSQK